MIQFFQPGDMIMIEGSPSNHFLYLLMEGGAEATKEELPEYLLPYKPGDHFGEMALHMFEDDEIETRRLATVSAGRGGAVCLLFTKKAFMTQMKHQHDRVHARDMEVYSHEETRARQTAGTSGRSAGLRAPASMVRAALAELEPIMPRAYLARIMATGVYGVAEASSDSGGPEEEAGWKPVSGSDEVEVMVFMTNLKCGMCILRFSRPMEAGEVGAGTPGMSRAFQQQEAAKFLRQLSDKEKESIEACFNEIDRDFSGSLSKVGAPRRLLLRFHCALLAVRCFLQGCCRCPPCGFAAFSLTELPLTADRDRRAAAEHVRGGAVGPGDRRLDRPG